MEDFKWDVRFLELAKTVSTWSKDPSTKVGAVIVRPDKSVVSLGYNGFPRKMKDSPELYSNRDEKYSRIIHAEINAVLQAKVDVTGCTLYTYPFMPCDRCAVQMIQAGIDAFVYPRAMEDALQRWGSAFIKVEQYFKECRVKWREY